MSAPGGGRNLWTRAFGAGASWAVTHPWRVVVLSLVVTAGALGVSTWRLGLKTSNLDLVDPSLPEVAGFLEFAGRFGTPNMLVIVLDGEGEAALREAVARVREEVLRVAGVRAVLGRLPYEPVTLLRLGIDPYFTSKDRRQFYVYVQPDDPSSSAATIAPFVHGVRAALDRAGLAPLGVRAGLTGLPQYALDDRTIIQRDMTVLSAISFVIVLLIFIAAFGELVRPVAAMIGLALVSAWVVGFATFYPGHLTLLSAFFFSALFGLGSDYGIFVIDGIEERLAEGQAKLEAILGSVRFLASGLATETLATAVAFLTLCASGFRGFAELGVIAAVGLVLSLVAMVVLLPALLALGRKPRGRERKIGERRLGRALHAMQSPVAAVALGVASIAGLALGFPSFDGNYHNLQPRASEAARLERDMVARSAMSPQFAAFETDSPEAAASLAARLRKEPTVGLVRSIADLRLLDTVAAPIPGERRTFASAFASADGRYAVYAYPAGNVWDPEFADRFLAAMKRIDPGVTGMPVLGRFMIDLSKHALKVTGLLSGLVVLVLVWTEFGNTRWTPIAFTPVALSLAATVSVMKACGLDFNPINVMAFPVIVGTGVDAGVHITHRFLAEKGDLFRTMAGSARSVLVSTLTTIAGFGTLIFTSHRGLASFALAMTIGVVAALALSLFLLPQLLVRAMPRRRAAGGYVAFTRGFFGRWSALYDLFAVPIGFAYGAAVRRAGARPGRRILDVCTGTGEIALRCARRGAEVTAIDMTASMMDRARRKAAARNLAVRFAMMDARALAFPDGSFDVAIVSFALHDMPRRVRVDVLREAARVAREVLVLDYEPPEEEPWRSLVVRLIASYETPYFANFIRVGALASFAEAGLRIVSRSTPLPGWFAVYDLRRT